MDKASVLSALDALQNYEKEYEERKRKHKEDENGTLYKSPGLETGQKKKSIQEEIAETLRKIKEQEDANAKKFEEERIRKEEKRQKELEVKEKIQRELQKIKELEEMQNAQIKKEREEKEKKKLELLELEKKEMQRLEAENLKALAEQRKQEIIERKKLFEEVEEIKFKKAHEDARILIKENKEKLAEKARNDLGILRFFYFLTCILILVIIYYKC
jgi:hypothetical protein